MRSQDFPTAYSQNTFAVDFPAADVNHPRVDFRIGKMRMERDSVPAMMILEQGMMSHPASRIYGSANGILFSWAEHNTAANVQMLDIRSNYFNFLEFCSFTAYNAFLYIDIAFAYIDERLAALQSNYGVSACS